MHDRVAGTILPLFVVPVVPLIHFACLVLRVLERKGVVDLGDKMLQG